MNLPWWGWLLVAAWCTAGVWVFVVGTERQFGSVGALCYYFVDERGFRPLRFALRLLPLAVTFVVVLVVGPVLLALDLLTRGERRRREEMRAHGRQRRIARKLARQQARNA